jgi:serine/threonine-protein kinase
MTDNPRLRQLLDELLSSHATPEEVCASCPELLPQLRVRWQKMCLLRAELDALFPASPAQSASPPAESPAGTVLPQVPGYEVKAELGHGGMGVVFRAWHLRLNRPVALKMLLAGAYARPEERSRFLREAEAVAALRHPNIVPVYDAGDVDGRPYFTMELVEGGSLAGKLAGTPQPAREAAALLATLAEAVEAAHRSGIVHRDLKPGNILLTPDGVPKITDFGLARRLEDGNGLTLSGVPVGTPSYMSPCQARGDKSAMGPATDVYALGAILYECLTGRPPFRAETPTATLQQVLADDPVPPARLNPRVPRDLETICLKCLDKEPLRRYASAQALADDLRRFERGEPITARPLGWLGRLARWARRRPAAAALSGVLVVTAALALVLVGGWLWLDGQRRATARATARAADDDLREADRLMRQGDLTRARAALERANGRLGTGGAPDMQDRVRQAEAELQRREGREEQARQFRERLDAIRLVRCALVDGHFDRLRSDREYEEAFRSAGLDPFEEPPQVVADRINGSPARAALVAALDDWAVCAAHKLRRDWLLAVARLADPDPWRDRVRDPKVYWDLKNLQELTRKPVEGQSLQLLVALGERLHTADPRAALPFLRQVQQAYPGDFFANFWVAYAEEPAMKVGYYRVAQAVRPNTAVANWNLAGALLALGRTEEAIPYLRRVAALDPADLQCRTLLAESSAKVAEEHKELARELQMRQQWAEAITHYRAAVALKPDWASTHYDLGMALNSPGHQDEAIEQLRTTLAIDPRYPAARANLVRILLDRGRADEAIAELRQAVALDPRNTGARAELRGALARLGRWPEVRAAWREELDAGPPEHDAWFGYAELCLFLGDEKEYRRARRDLLARFGAATDPAVAERTARACLLLPAPEDELRQAAALAQRAVAAGPPSGQEWVYPYFLFAKGLADYRLGRYDDALAVMSGEAAKAQYLGPSQRLITALALSRKGQKDEPLKTLAAAVVSYDWSAAKADRLEHWIAHVLRREAEALILPDLPAFLEGKYQPKDNERLALAGSCQFHGRRAAEAGLLAAALAADPKLAEDPVAGLRYRAARAAAVAGCGGGADGAALNDAERERWRRQTVAWLRLDLAAWTKRLEPAQPADRAEVQKVLTRWREEPDLTGLRDAAALERLPPAERQECLALWQEVADLLRRAETTR